MLTIISAYDFEKLLHTECSHGDEAFDTLENAKEKCKIKKECIGVFQKDCEDDKDYHECLKTSTLSTDLSNEGCLHKKFSIGKLINICFLYIRYRTIFNKIKPIHLSTNTAIFLILIRTIFLHL